MAVDEATNRTERNRWNNATWASIWPRREQLTNAVTALLLGQAKLVAGEKVLDIGSGGGTTAMAASPIVGEVGSVVGADISVPLVDFARSRAADRRLTNVRYVVADVQQGEIPGGPFDVAISQFGVMFFDEPVVAFANIRGHLIGTGRIAFACWQTVTQNPWHVGPVLARFAGPSPSPAPGKSATGPFTFSDPSRVVEILTSAGWTDIERETHDVVVPVEADAIADEGQLELLGVPEESHDDARAAIGEHLDRLRDADGTIKAPLSFQIFTARA